MITYNHEKFIAQALDSILMQKTNFRYEIVVGEDCSTDLTRAIVLEYQQKYPEKFKLLLHEKNIGMTANVIETLNACSGKYIALCEGDDYWTDPLKLQKQVDFLEKNEEYILVCNNSLTIYDQDDSRKNYSISVTLQDFDFSIRELMISNFNPITTLTAMFRNNLMSNYAVIPFDRYWAPDKQIWMFLTQFGKFRFIQDTVGVYRKHSGGITSSISNDKKKSIKLIKSRINNHQEWNIYYNYKYTNEIKYLQSRENILLVKLYLKSWDLLSAIQSSKNIDIAELKTAKQKIVIFLLRLLSTKGKSNARH